MVSVRSSADKYKGGLKSSSLHTITFKGEQEPIWSVQLPYSVCETAFSQVGLFLD